MKCNPVVFVCALAASIWATVASAQQSPPESIEIGLSTETIAITSDFSGQIITIFGAVDNVDPLVQRQGRYDVFVILEGPRSSIVTRKKGRVLGVWMNVEDHGFDNVPQSYLVTTTRLPRDVTDTATIERLGLDTGKLRMAPIEESERTSEFAEATKALKSNRNLYALFPSSVHFVSQSLFRAQLAMPANVPLGVHRVKAFLFRNGQLVATTGAPLRIEKAGLEFEIFRFAQEQPLFYGFASVLLALCVGWLGRVIFRKD